MSKDNKNITELATLSDDHRTITLHRDEGEPIEVSKSAVVKTLKSGAMTFVNQKTFIEKNDLTNAEGKRLYKAMLNVVGRANAAMVSAITNGKIVSKIHEKTNKAGERTGAVAVEYKPVQHVPEKKEPSKKKKPTVKSVASQFKELSEAERLQTMKELGLA